MIQAKHHWWEDSSSSVSYSVGPLFDSQLGGRLPCDVFSRFPYSLHENHGVVF
jgi:hypothetical protein